jgi:hypothetical protein
LEPENPFLAVGIGCEASSQDAQDFLPGPTQTGTETLLPWEFSFDFSTNPADFSEPLQSESVLPQMLDQSATEAPAADMLESILPLDNTQDTTLCTLAISLVLKNNRKNYTATDLDLRLRAGYRCGFAASEGCRVDNKILFGLLAEIS